MSLNQPEGHVFVDMDGDGLCDYVTDFHALERRCLNLERGHKVAKPLDSSPNEDRFCNEPFSLPPRSDSVGGEAEKRGMQLCGACSVLSAIPAWRSRGWACPECGVHQMGEPAAPPAPEPASAREATWIGVALAWIKNHARHADGCYSMRNFERECDCGLWDLRKLIELREVAAARAALEPERGEA